MHPCSDCGKLCYYNAIRCKRCSVANHNHKQIERRKEKDSPRYARYEEEKKKPCRICGDLIRRHSSLCRSCHDKSVQGENSPNWRGGKSPYYNSEWRIARDIARKRAGGHCEKCGISEEANKRRLDTHHIKEIRLFLMPIVSHDSKNLICLCRKCHAKFHHPKSSSFSPD